jgi:membrane-associated phospholipid phosphatase
MVDVLYQAYFQALLILLATPTGEDPNFNGIGAPYDQGNPYTISRTQAPFGTFGAEQILAMVPEVATRALKAQWFQKWRVHRRLRPEEFGGKIQLQLSGERDYPIHSDVLDSEAVKLTYQKYDSHLLPQAFPQGCPAHPAYGSGHATVAGACVTLIKAFFDESYVIPNPVQASADGLSLIPYEGPPLTLGGELNKVAANISIARDFAGVHWRSDGVQSMLLGEQIAISLLRGYRLTYNEPFNGFSLTTFSGRKITV